MINFIHLNTDPLQHILKDSFLYLLSTAYLQSEVGLIAIVTHCLMLAVAENCLYHSHSQSLCAKK